MEKTIARYKSLVNELLASPSLNFDEYLRKKLPQIPGVYQIIEIKTDLFISIYVGQSSNLRSRIHGDHFMGNRRSSTLKRKLIVRDHFSNENGVKEFLRKQCAVRYIEIEDERDRKYFEHFVIAILKPIYND